jgi:mono/diheme cytochrome c family protein
MHKATIAAFAVLLASLQTTRSATDGVYTSAQAERGRAHYERTCQPCHGADLRGSAGAALVGDGFVRNWSGLGLDRLLDRIRTMPPDSPERPGDPAALELVAYILSANGFPAGESELEMEGINRIRIEEQGGGSEVPNFSLVAIVGCLARGAGGEWIVTRATDPIRTKNPDASTGEERTRAAAAAAGVQTYRLLNVYPSPEKIEGHAVEARGFLIRGPADTINVTALASLATTCPR